MSLTIFQVICNLNTFLTLLFNGLLISLILRNSPRSMANYKYLMLIFAIFGVSFGLVDFTNQPTLHFFQGSYIVFSKNYLGLPRSLAFFYIALNCCCYGMILVLLTFHFVYRYFAVCRPHLLHLFSWPRFNIFIFIFLLITTQWMIVAMFMAAESDYTNQYIKETMWKTFGLQQGEYVYACSIFYRLNPETGLEYFSLPDFAWVSDIGAIIGVGFSIILFCWHRLRSQLIKSARQHHNYSQKTLEMQRQLFNSLIAQTVFPCFLMFLPATVILIFPLFKIEPGPSEGILLSLITTQPFLDALVPMYFIKDYRTRILRLFRGNRTDLSALHVSMGSRSVSRRV